MEHICIQCEKKFTQPGSRPRKFCTKKCESAYGRVIIICKFCKQEISVIKSKEKTQIYCSQSCSSKDSIEARKQGMINKYGVATPYLLPDHYDKVKKTKLERYGNENYTNIKKMKQTKLERYGDENYFDKEKAKQTKLERYGDENFNNIEKAKQTIEEKYGMDNYIQMQIDRTTQLSNNGIIGFKSESYKKYLSNNNITNISQLLEVKEKKNIKQRYKAYGRLLLPPASDIAIPLFKFEEYSGSKNYQMYKFLCKTCNLKFEDWVTNGSNPRCLNCYPLTKQESYDEQRLREFLITNEIKIEIKNRTILEGKEIDIFLPDYNIGIEYHGLYYHSEQSGGKNREYHADKYKKCLIKNIRLIQIFSDEWLTKESIVKNRLLYILNKKTESIYARNCTIQKITYIDAYTFLKNNHIQEPIKSPIRYGLFNENNILIAVMMFGKCRLALGGNSFADDTYELTRFASSVNIPGGASKLFSYFIKEYSPKEIISYSDNRWSTGKMYQFLGFTQVSDGTPGYWYTNYKERYHRFAFRKNKLQKLFPDNFDINKTEWENMQNNKFDRIWDCGHKKFIWYK